MDMNDAMSVCVNSTYVCMFLSKLSFSDEFLGIMLLEIIQALDR